MALPCLLFVAARAEGAEEQSRWTRFGQSWSQLPFPSEWSAALTFHAPGNTDFIDSSMSYSVTDEAVKFRFLRYVSKSYISPDFAQPYDEVIHYPLVGEEAGDDSVHVMAEGQKCQFGGNWDMFAMCDMKVADEVERAALFDGSCDTVLVSRPAWGNATFCLGSGGVPQELNIRINPALSGQTNAGMYT